MCGFVGFVRNKQIMEEDKFKLNKMADAINHRGPDQAGVFFTENLCFAFRRLSIIDLEKGYQPFHYDNDRYVAIFNGEIYNYIELREELIKKGYVFSTNSEIEVICASYKEYGKDFIKKLRGMFSLFIWDNEKGILLGGRDPFGIKPFYYRENEEGLYFASEAKAFMLNDETRPSKVNEESLHHYLTFQFVPEPKTMFEDIFILEAGCIIEKKLGEKAKIERYVNLDFTPVIKNEEDGKKAIREALENSVKFHMRSDVPVATFLSGGIDSTIIATLASKINPNIKSFTIGFDVNGYSEADLAKETADHLGIENIRKVITAEEYMNELPNIVWHLDSPVADPAAIPIYFISKETAKHAKVVLSGEGADELFGGYTIYHEVESLKILQNMPGFLKSGLKGLSKAFPEGMKGKSFLERGTTDVEDRFVGNAKIFLDNEKSSILKNYNPNFNNKIITDPIYAKVRNMDDVIKMQYMDLNTWLRGDILVKSDRMTMAHALELRVPFLDMEVFNVAKTLTLQEKIGHDTTKYLLRAAFADIIPKPAVERRKLGYPVPIRVWLKDEMYDWAYNLIMHGGAEQFINQKEALRLLEDHRRGVKDYSRKIWTILIFILWHKIFLIEGKKKNFKYGNRIYRNCQSEAASDKLD